MSKIYSCKNLGCRIIFKCPIQCAKYETKCLKPAPDQEKQKIYIQIDIEFPCSKCYKQLVFLSNALRHGEKCFRRKEKALHLCTLHLSWTSPLLEWAWTHLNTVVKWGRKRLNNFFGRGDWCERGGHFLEGGSGLLEKAIVNFTSWLLFDFCVCADWKILYHMLFFTYIYKTI